jgi:hypothetical protein
MRALFFASLWVALLSWNALAGTITDPTMGYTLQLPDHWEQIKSRDIHHHFKDSTGLRPAKLSILRYPIDSTDYPTPESWTQAQFIGYMLAVETSAFPFGLVTFYDSSSTRKLGQDWAPEVFSTFFPGDTTKPYCEYLRYCSHGNFGYEIYAIGDSTEMVNEVDYYANILSSIIFTTPIASLRPMARPAQGLLPVLFYDARGRKLKGSQMPKVSKRSAGIVDFRGLKR